MQEDPLKIILLQEHPYALEPQDSRFTLLTFQDCSGCSVKKMKEATM